MHRGKALSKRIKISPQTIKQWLLIENIANVWLTSACILSEMSFSLLGLCNYRNSLSYFSMWFWPKNLIAGMINNKPGMTRLAKQRPDAELEVIDSGAWKLQRTDHLACSGRHVAIWWGVSVHINLGDGLEWWISSRLFCHSDGWDQMQSLAIVLKHIFTQLWDFIF